MIRPAVLAGVAVACVLVSPAGGTSTPRPPVALTASPAQVRIDGRGEATIRLRNPGSSQVVVDAARAGFALDLRGRPKIARAGPRAAVSWLRLRPARLTLRPGGTASLTVAAKAPARARPGDHDALVLLTTRPRPGVRTAVRMRLGVVVVVRAPGTVVRRLEPRAVSVRRSGRLRVLEVVVANRGNVRESIRADGVRLSLVRRGAVRATLRPSPRELRPGTRGIVQFAYQGPLRGPTTVRVEVMTESGAVKRRTFRVRL